MLKQTIGVLHIIGGLIILYLAFAYAPGISFSNSPIDKVNYAVTMLSYALGLAGVLFILQGIATLVRDK